MDELSIKEKTKMELIQRNAQRSVAEFELARLVRLCGEGKWDKALRRMEYWIYGMFG